MVLFHQGRDALGSLAGQTAFDLGNQRTGNSLPPVVGVDRQPVDVPPPAVERTDDRADQPPSGLGNENVSGAFEDCSLEVFRCVRDAGCRIGLPPELQNRLHVFQATITNGDRTAIGIAHGITPPQEGRPSPR